jgi:hypothetical protein
MRTSSPVLAVVCLAVAFTVSACGGSGKGTKSDGGSGDGAAAGGGGTAGDGGGAGAGGTGGTGGIGVGDGGTAGVGGGSGDMGAMGDVPDGNIGIADPDASMGGGDGASDTSGTGGDAPINPTDDGGMPADAPMGVVDVPVSMDGSADAILGDVPQMPDVAKPDAAPPGPTVQLRELVPGAVSRRLTTNVDLLGQLFVAGARVRITSCAMMGTSYEFMATVTSPTNARITIPADLSRIQGLYTVTITNPDSSSASLDCTLRVLDASPPTVTKVVPASAWQGAPGDGINSDQTIQITGTGFSPTPRVRFRSVSDPNKLYDAISVSWVSATQLTAVVPSETLRMPIGTYHVLVENPNLLTGQWFTDAGMTTPGIFRITDVPPPRIDSINPVRCPQSGGNLIPPCPTVTATGAHIQTGATFSLLVPAGSSCASGWTKEVGIHGDECLANAANRTDAQNISANTSGFGIGLYPIKVTNPDGQFTIFYSFAVTASSEGHLSGAFVPTTATLNEGRWRHAADFAFDDFGNSYIYVAGGQKDAAGAPLDTVELSNISRTGMPSPWQLARQYKPTKDPTNVRGQNTLVSGRTGLTMVHVGPYLYAIGGALASTNTSAGSVTDGNKTDASNQVERARVLGYETMPRRHLPSASGSVGLPKGTWYYRVSAVSSEGESLPSLPMQLIGGRGQITVCWDPPPLQGLTYTYNVYRNPAADGRANTERLLATEVPGPCYVDTGFGDNQPAPGRLSGTDVATPAGKPGLALGNWIYRVSATVSGKETLAGYPATVAVTTAGRQAVQLTWDPAFGATYNLYRVPVVNGAAGTEIRLASGLTSPSYTDDGSVTPGTATPQNGVAPLPLGSLTRWQLAPRQGGGVANMVHRREGADAVVVSITDAQMKPRTFIFVGGGRADNKTGTSYGVGDGADNNYHKTIERTEVFQDGTLSAFAVEAQKFNRPRAFFPLLTTQGMNETPAPPPPKEPPCEDLDGDGFLSCSCFRPAPSCTPGNKTPACVPDCNDLDKTVYPGAAEICGDGKDQDCDGNVCNYTTGTCSVCGGTDLMCPAGVDAGAPPDTAPPPTNPMMPSGCTPRDEDGDGYMSCSCFTVPANCFPDDPSPRCAADCCDRPGDPGCPASVTTLAQAKLINPGVEEIMCDGVDNNCAVENDYLFADKFVCGGGTDACLIAQSRLEPRSSPFGEIGGVTEARPVLQTLATSTTYRVSLPAETVIAQAATPIWLLACQGDDSYETGGSGNQGTTQFEACAVSPIDGHLEDCSTSLPGSLWVVQNSTFPGGQKTHGHDAALYFNFVFPFRGVASEALGSFASPAMSSASRYPVDDLTSDPAKLLGSFQSSSASFITSRAYYQMVRLNSYLYVIGGTNGTSALGSMELHQQ